MSCSPTLYPSCPTPALAYFGGVLPSINITYPCCNYPSATVTFNIVGTNTQLGSIYIDGTTSPGIGCEPLFGLASAPCFLNDQSGALVVVSSTLGGIETGNSFAINVEYTFPVCGDCLNESTYLRVWVTTVGLSVPTNTCCYFDIPITITLGDALPFSVLPTTLNLNSAIENCTCENLSFNITNESCDTQVFDINSLGFPSGMTVLPSQVTLNSLEVSVPIVVQYCPINTTGGIATVTVINQVAAGCDAVQHNVTINYDAIAMKWSCVDGHCVQNCDGTFDTLDECNPSCIPDPAVNFCFNCDFLQIDGVAYENNCNTICANIGQELCIVSNIGFPLREFAIQNVVLVDNTIAVLGNWTIPEGCAFTITFSDCGNDGIYTSGSYTYDPITNTTIIVVVEPLTCDTEGINWGIITYTEDIGLCPQCVPTATVVITNLVTGEIILNETHTATLNWIYINDCVTLTTFGDYSIVLTANDCFETKICEYKVSACQQYTIVKTDCHKYLITDTSVNVPTKINTIIVSNFSGSYTETYEMVIANGNTLEIILPQDDVYTITITDNLSTTTFTDVIYDFCDLITCYRKLVLDIFCNEKDPCCKECDAAALHAIDFKRNELNKLNALAGSLFAYIHRDKIVYLGIYSVEDCRITDIQMIADLASKINEILDRCGECQKSKVIVSTPCSTC